LAPASQSWTFAAVGIIALTCASAWALSKKYPYLITGWLWFVGMLIPVIGIVPVGGQAHADRYTYLPMIGLAMAFSFAAADVVRGREKAVRAAAALGISVVLALFTAGAWRQAAYWTDSETLWRRALAIDGSNHLAHSLMGDLYRSRKDMKAAEAEFLESLKTGPRNLIARIELGSLLAEQGKLDEAERQFRKVIEASPSRHFGYLHMGDLAVRRHDNAAAVKYYEKALELQPDDEASHVGIAIALRNENQLVEAMRHELIALNINPQSVDAHRNLANLLASIGRRPDAIEHYRSALELSPHDVASATYLAWILATSPHEAGGDPREAIRLLEPLCRAEKGTSEQFDALAAAYAANGQFDDALRASAQAKESAIKRGKKRLAEDIESRRKLYAEHKPYRESQ
jgi:tetratricopeptide (TPR) repeat protein